MATLTTPHQLELSDLKRDWIERTVAEVLGLAEAGKLVEVWSTDDLHALVAEAPYEVNWWGCLAAKMRNKGLIIRTGSIPSKRPEANGRWIATWKVRVAPAGQ
jgi:hypothetical protein